MTFYRFMMRKHLKEDGPIGAFAKDIKYDTAKFPRNGKGKFTAWHDLILDYLENNGACEKCIEVFENCWEEYIECEKKQSNRN